MSNTIALVNETTKSKSTRPVKIWREHPVTDNVIFKGMDEAGRSGWFLRLTVSGLYPRRIGPYRTKEQALQVLEEFVADVQVEVLLDIENDQKFNQAYVVEGVPMLVGSVAERQENV